MTLHEGEADPADAAAWGGSGKSKPPAKLHFVQLDPVGGKNLPPRPWAYGKFMLFGTAAVLGAVDGGGKGAIAVSMVIAIITGHPLLGEKVWRKGPVAIITYEDDVTEWHRRIAAACAFHGTMFPIDYDYVIKNIRFIQGVKERVSFATIGEGGRFVSDAAEIIEMLTEFQAVALIVDPFNHAHNLDDGNSNVLIAKVAAEMSRVAHEAFVAVLVLHHLRKGANGAPDDLMGALALRATFRSCRILVKMTAEVATKMNLEDHWRYIRIAGSKENYAPPPDQSTWFKLESVSLDNGNDEYPDGDNMGVATPWAARPMFEGMSAKTLSTVFTELQHSLHSKAKQSKNLPWAGRVLMDAGKRNETEAVKIVAAWVESGVLTEDDQWVKGNKVKGLTVDAVKVAEIMASLEPVDLPID